MYSWTFVLNSFCPGHQSFLWTVQHYFTKLLSRCISKFNNIYIYMRCERTVRIICKILSHDIYYLKWQSIPSIEYTSFRLTLSFINTRQVSNNLVSNVSSTSSRIVALKSEVPWYWGKIAFDKKNWNRNSRDMTL